MIGTLHRACLAGIAGIWLAVPAGAQDLAPGLSSEGEFVGMMIDKPVRFVAVYYGEQDRHSLQAGRIFGHPQVSVMASSIDEDGTPGRPILVLSFDPDSPADNPNYVIGQARLIDDGGRDAPLLAFAEDADAILWDFSLTPDGEVMAEIALQFRRYGRDDSGDLVRTSGDEIETTLTGTFTGQLAGRYLEYLE